MRMRQLQCFVVLAEELSFTRAAQRLNMSQPPLSTQIQTLERELGVDLINRTSRKIALTHAGKLFRRYANSMLDQYERSLQEMREIQHGQEGMVEIGTTGSILRGGLSELLSDFAQAYPQITLRIHEQSPLAQIDEVRRRRMDLSFNRSIPHDSELAHEHAWQEELVALVRSDHRLAGSTSVSLREFSDDPFVILQPESSDFAAYVMSCVVASGYRPRISQQVIDAQSIPSLVAAGFGVSIVPAGIAHLTSGPVVFLPIHPEPPVSDIYIIYHKDDPTPVLRLFLAEIRGKLNAARPGRKGP
ncbi:LysR substrate-binding domain-containing protein [Ochrobactrum sp. BD67]